MKQLKILGMALIAVFALAAVAAATASAELGEVTPGLLFLKSPTFPITLTSSGGPATLRVGGEAVVCQTFKNEAKFENENGSIPPHVVLIKNVKIHFSECTALNGAVSCRGENAGGKDPKGTILVVVDVHFVALLNAAKELRPGVIFIVLGKEGAEAEEKLVINCGILKIEVKGAVAGEVLLKESGEDITLLTVDLPTALKCDTSDELCKKLLEEKPFLARKEAVFEPAEQEAKVDVHFTEMVKVDD
ncbi:MAG: hypothetical protein ACHQHO_13860 [Solirubrobacterales bacterium]